MRTWALELEFAEMDKPRRKKAQVKGLDLYPLIWADKNQNKQMKISTLITKCTAGCLLALVFIYITKCI